MEGQHHFHPFFAVFAIAATDFAGAAADFAGDATDFPGGVFGAVVAVFDTAVVVLGEPAAVFVASRADFGATAVGTLFDGSPVLLTLFPPPALPTLLPPPALRTLFALSKLFACGDEAYCLKRASVGVCVNDGGLIMVPTAKNVLDIA